MKYLQKLFGGRINRRSFLLGLITNVVAFCSVFVPFMALNIISATLNNSILGTISSIFFLLTYLIAIVLSSALYIRRLHDINRSGWWVFLLQIPLLGFIFFLFLLFKKGVTEKNKYGKTFSFNKFQSLLLFNVIFLSGLIITSAVLYQRHKAYKLFEQGNKLLVTDPYLSSSSYWYAQENWPWINSDTTYKYNIKRAQELISRPGVIIFLKDTATDEEIDSLIDQINTIPGVKYLNFTTKEQALEIYKARNKDNPVLLELVTADILPASIEVYIIDLRTRERVRKAIESKSFIEAITP